MDEFLQSLLFVDVELVDGNSEHWPINHCGHHFTPFIFLLKILVIYRDHRGISELLFGYVALWLHFVLLGVVMLVVSVDVLLGLPDW